MTCHNSEASQITQVTPGADLLGTPTGRLLSPGFAAGGRHGRERRVFWLVHLSVHLSLPRYRNICATAPRGRGRGGVVLIFSFFWAGLNSARGRGRMGKSRGHGRMFCSPAWSSSARIQLAQRQWEEPCSCSSASTTTSSNLSLILAVYFFPSSDVSLVGPSHTWLNRNMLQTDQGNWVFSAKLTGWGCLTMGCRIRLK